MGLKNLIAAIVLAMLSAMPLTAQQEPVFKDHDEMRAVLDELVMSRQVKELTLRFGGSRTLNDIDLDALQEKVERIYPYDFKHSALIKTAPMQNGFRHEMYAYWTGLSYMYVLVLLHDRGESLVAINMRWNTDVYDLLGDI